MVACYHHLSNANIRNLNDGGDLPKPTLTTDEGAYLIGVLSYLHQSGIFTFTSDNLEESAEVGPLDEELGLIITHEVAQDALPMLSVLM